MRRQDFIASPGRVQEGENSNGFRAVTAAGDVTDNPMPRQCFGFGPNMNGDRWAQFPWDTDASPPVVATGKKPRKRR